MKKTSKSLEVLAALRTAAEGCRWTDKAGFAWQEVYLDNAKALLPKMSRRQFAGHLATLKAEGFYQPEDGEAFGAVRFTIYATDRPGDQAAIYAEENGVSYSEALVACNMD